ncbi:MAG: exonuclease domain-containing protein [Isosphaeraceae bacterium]
MLMNLVLERPLAVLDLETTGVDPKVDRIVEISVLKILTDGSTVQRTRRLNPGIPIPAEATDIHGICDADVRDEPRFSQVAGGLLFFLDGCDLCGFNLKRFDLRILLGEYARAGMAFPLDGRFIIDPMEIFHERERRDLTAAVKFYCGQNHEGAHGAAQDTRATAAVLDTMLARYQDLPRSVSGLHDLFQESIPADSEGKFTRSREGLIMNFGPHRGQSLDQVSRENPGFLRWMLGKEFGEDVKDIVRAALA